MCNPAFVMVGVSLFSAMTQAQAQRSQAQYENGVAQYNARVTENEAQEVRNAANEAENIQRRRTAELVSRQRAALGAANVDIDSGSPLQIQEDALTLGEVDALRIRSNATAQINAMNSQSSLLRSRGRASLIAGDNAATGSYIKGVAGALGSGVADKWFTADSTAMQATA